MPGIVPNYPIRWALIRYLQGAGALVFMLVIGVVLLPVYYIGYGACRLAGGCEPHPARSYENKAEQICAEHYGNFGFWDGFHLIKAMSPEQAEIADLDNNTDDQGCDALGYGAAE